MIVSVAIDHQSKIWALPAPARHSDVIGLIFAKTGEPVPGSSIQGFIDSEEGFVCRKRALQIVKSEGQKMRSAHAPGGRLYSENLW